jgi:hypothetical protein
MGIRFGQKFDISCFSQFFEALQNFRGIEPELVDGGSGYTETYFEAASIFFDKIVQDSISGEIAFLSNFMQNAFVAVIIVIVVVVSYIKESVASEPERLMYLKV